jgi:hypothetical protein
MWDWLAAAVGIQHRAQRGDGVVMRAVVDVHATAVGFHEPTQLHQFSGKPCTSITGGPSAGPASAT